MMRRDSLKNLAGAPPPAEFWDLRLFIAGRTRRAVEALATLNALCEAYLKGRYAVEVIDILERPELAEAHNILAIPTLIRVLPTPVRRIIGGFSDEQSVLKGLDIQ